MKVQLPEEFVDLCRQIVSEKRCLSDWAKIESDDMFQTEHFVGGFDATENCFCFSYFDEAGKEFWFQINLEDVTNIVTGTLTSVEVRERE